MRSIYDRFDGIKICIAPTQISRPLSLPSGTILTIQHTGRITVPMLLPKSVAWNTLTLKSCWTLPTISAALLSWRCASYGALVSPFLLYAHSASFCPVFQIILSIFPPFLRLLHTPLLSPSLLVSSWRDDLPYSSVHLCSHSHRL